MPAWDRRGASRATISARRPSTATSAREYLRDNIKYYLGESERAGLELFYRYAAEIGVVPEEADRRRCGFTELNGPEHAAGPKGPALHQT